MKRAQLVVFACALSCAVVSAQGGNVGQPQAASPPEVLEAQKLSAQVLELYKAGKFQEATEKAAKQARFKPTLLSGKPVSVRGIITYRFVGR